MNSRRRVKQQKRYEKWMRDTCNQPAVRPISKNSVSQYAVEMFRRKPYGGNYETS